MQGSPRFLKTYTGLTRLAAAEWFRISVVPAPGTPWQNRAEAELPWVCGQFGFHSEFQDSLDYKVRPSSLSQPPSLKNCK